MTRAVDILGRAADLVGGDRAAEHGDSVACLDAIAALWRAFLETRIDSGLPPIMDGSQVADMMELLKVARRQGGKFNLDDYTDGAGYAAIGGEYRVRKGNGG